MISQPNDYESFALTFELRALVKVLPLWGSSFNIAIPRILYCSGILKPCALELYPNYVAIPRGNQVLYLK